MKTRKCNRLQEYDYSNPAWYFVTICTKHNENRFGEIIRGTMRYNPIGNIADECWKNIETLHNHVDLDEYIIMPNHIHGIIIINKSVLGDANFASPNTDASPPDDRTKMELCKIIQQFKRAVTLKIRELHKNSDFKWQRSFYDRIIRNEKSFIISGNISGKIHSNGSWKKALKILL